MLTAVALLLLAAAPTESRADGGCVAIVSTNDVHGALEPHVLEGAPAKLRYGGMVTLASYVEALREKHGERLLLLDAGDLFQGTLVSNLSEGRAMLAALAFMRYDAATLGNHEFDFGAGEAWRPRPGVSEPTGEERLAVIKSRVTEAKLPYVIANVFDRQTGKPIAWPNAHETLLIDKGGVKVGIIGVITPETPRVTRPQNIETLEFNAPQPIVVAKARELRARGAELVVLLAHMGGACESTIDPTDLSRCEAKSELFTLLAALPKGTVDVALGAHTHQIVAHWVNGVATVEASARARALGYVEACAKRPSGLDAARTIIHPPIIACVDAWSDNTCGARNDTSPVGPAHFLGKPVVPSAALSEVIAPFARNVERESKRKVGVELAAPLLRDKNGESPLSQAVCEAMRKATGAPIAVHNRGGTRADLPAGSLTFGQVFEALPFDNRVAVLELTGAKLEAFVEHLLERSGGGPLTSGLLIQKTPLGYDLRLADGTPLVAEQRYQVATNDYLATGGEGLHLLGLSPADMRVLDLDLRQALIAYLRAKSPATAR